MKWAYSEYSWKMGNQSGPTSNRHGFSERSGMIPWTLGHWDDPSIGSSYNGCEKRRVPGNLPAECVFSAKKNVFFLPSSKMCIQLFSKFRNSCTFWDWNSGREPLEPWNSGPRCHLILRLRVPGFKQHWYLAPRKSYGETVKPETSLEPFWSPPESLPSLFWPRLGRFNLDLWVSIAVCVCFFWWSVEALFCW